MKICERALNFIQIIDHKGTVRVCGWIANNEIGSLADSTLKEIYHSERITAIRNKLMKQDYSDCLVDACPYCAMGTHSDHEVDIDRIPEYPAELYLAFERECNYKCTSCTTPGDMCKNDPDEEERGYRVIEKKLEDVLPYIKHISANGKGELFASPHTLNILANWKPVYPKEECSVSLESNGSLFDERHWNKISNLGECHLTVSITIMSFNESAYQYLSGTKLPIKQVEENLRFIKSLRERGIINHLELATVYQERNFRYLPEFTRRCIEEFGADEVRLRPYMPWRSRPAYMEWFYDIRNPKHPYYSEFVEIMKDPVFNHPKVKDWGGGLLSEANKIAPWDKAIKKEKLLSKALDVERLLSKVPSGYEKKIVLYGASDVAKVIVSRMRDKGIEPLYMIDRNSKKDEYEGVKIRHISDEQISDRDVLIIVTIWNGFEEVRRNLTKIGFREEMIFDLAEM